MTAGSWGWGGRARRAAAAGLTVGVAATVLAVATPDAGAFKPNTHIESGHDAWSDAVDDGYVTINGGEYQVPPRVVTALEAWPSYYNAGVIGPDGFPDLTMGQSVIHPENTGLWLSHLLDTAWVAQDDVVEPGAPNPDDDPANPSYTDAEEGQILAFTYGFLTHAAGDLWAHTLVNPLSGEVFPQVGEILTDEDAAAIALRHVLIEGYVGSATAGFDNDPAEELLAGGDVSDDSTVGVPLDAPVRFVYDALVDPNSPGAPTTERGPIIDFFLDLRAQLDAFLDSTPDPLDAAIDQFEDFKADVEAAFEPGQCDGVDNDGDGDVDEGCIPDSLFGDEDDSGVCSFGAGDTTAGAVIDVVEDIVACPIVLGVEFAIESGEAALAAIGTALEAAAKPLLDAYVAAWIEDIDDGLAAWGELGLATTRGLFDPQTRRDAQNDECSSFGPDVVTPEDPEDETNPRRVCEDGVGVVDTVLFASEDFINEHLLSMLGAPDVIGELRALLDEVAGLIDDILGPALNPLRQIGNAIDNFAMDLVKDAISERLGIDVELIESLLEDPSTRIDVESVDLGPLGTINVLGPEVRATVDSYLGLDSHDAFEPIAPGETFDKDAFETYDNTVTMAKMLLLDGSGMDALLSDLMGRDYDLYDDGDPRTNVMTETLPGVGPADQWLAMIDGDHAWRQDGLPTFDDPNHPPAGAGNFPLYESCALRERGFRALFDDWENDDTPGIGDGDGVLDPQENFPDLGDTPSFDPNDPLAPESTLTVGSPSVVQNATTWVTGSTPLTLDATDDFWHPEEIGIDWRIAGGTFATVEDGTVVDLSGQPDGPVGVEHRAVDPCRTEDTVTTTLSVDNTPPTITITTPVADPPSYETDDFVAVSFSAVDAGVGVDTASSTVAIDGTPVAVNHVVDTYLLDAGLHTVTVGAADLLANSTTADQLFRVRATTASLLSNLERARSEGDVPDTNVYRGLRDKLNAALRAHNRGQHSTEWNQLEAFVEQLEAQAGLGIDAEIAERFIGYVLDLIAAGG